MTDLSQFIGKQATPELWAEINRVLGQTIVDGNGTHTITIETCAGVITDLRLDELPVKREVFIPLPATFMGYPVVANTDVPNPMEGMRFGGPDISVPPIKWTIEIEPQ